jgi:hypothetical protein
MQQIDILPYSIPIAQSWLASLHQKLLMLLPLPPPTLLLTYRATIVH